MVREFSEEKRQEIFRLLDEIDNREWKSFMEWCGSSAEEFGDWPDRLAVSAYTKYVDEYHKKVLELNEMTRNRVNTVFENVAEINARYAGRMKDCQEKIKEQIAMVRTMTEFMDSMTDGIPNMALIAKGSVNESVDGLKVENMKEVEIETSYADTATGEDPNIIMIEINCYEIRNRLSLGKCGIEDCMNTINELYQKGFVSGEDYTEICELAEEEKSNPNCAVDDLQKYFDHVITTVYIFNCLKVLASRTFTPEECCEANEIFRLFGITDHNSIANLLVCCAGESDGFKYTRENYEKRDGYSWIERGAGYFQVTGEALQRACLQYIFDLYGIRDDVNHYKKGYVNELAKYPWEASAWYWAICPVVSGQTLNSYDIERMDENGGELTLGIVLTTESFANGVVYQNNKDGSYTMNGALHVIARYDSLRINDEGNNGGWFIDGKNENCVLHIPADMLGIPDGTPASNIQSVWDPSTYLEFRAPNNWGTYEVYYNNLRDAGLLDFDLNTNSP